MGEEEKPNTKPSREERTEQINRDARSIMASEKAAADAKTARLRALRLAQEKVATTVADKKAKGNARKKK